MEFQSRTDVEPLPEWTTVFCSGPNFLCSKYGIRQRSCVAERFAGRVGTADFMNAVVKRCYFVDRPVNQMTNNLKRNVLYYWFATNIYFVKGSGNRKELPECIQCLVRMTFPNNISEPYKQFAAKPKKNRK